MRAIFMGTPDFAVNSLESILSLGIEIPLVITKEDSKQGRKMKLEMSAVKKRALELNLEVYQPNNLRDLETISLIKNINPDIIIVTAYGKVLPKEILEIPKHGCINVHASLLPSYRGASPINTSILNGDTVTGVTTMFMNEYLDEGDIILQDEIQIMQEDNSQTLTNKLAKLSEKTLQNTLKLILMNLNVPRTKQDSDVASYCTLLTKEMGHINYHDTAEKIINRIRGLQPWPYAYSFYQGINFKIYDAKILESKSQLEAGTIIKCSEGQLIVSTGDFDISFEEIQFAGKKRMKITDFLRGNKLIENTVLE